MADKQITVGVPEDRVAEFYAWFAAFLAAEPGAGPRRRMRHGPGHAPRPWTADDLDEAAWLYRKLAPPARALFDVLIDAPGERVAGNEIAARLQLEKGAHGVAGILAWPGRYCRKLGRPVPVDTAGRDDGGTDYLMAPEVAALFARAREAGSHEPIHRRR